MISKSAGAQRPDLLSLLQKLAAPVSLAPAKERAARALEIVNKDRLRNLIVASNRAHDRRQAIEKAYHQTSWKHDTPANQLSLPGKEMLSRRQRLRRVVEKLKAREERLGEARSEEFEKVDRSIGRRIAKKRTVRERDYEQQLRDIKLRDIKLKNRLAAEQQKAKADRDAFIEKLKAPAPSQETPAPTKAPSIPPKPPEPPPRQATIPPKPPEPPAAPVVEAPKKSIPPPAPASTESPAQTPSTSTASTPATSEKSNVLPYALGGAGVVGAGALGAYALRSKGDKAMSGSGAKKGRQKRASTGQLSRPAKMLRRAKELLSGSELGHLRQAQHRNKNILSDVTNERNFAHQMHANHPSEETWKEVQRTRDSLNTARSLHDKANEAASAERLKVYGSRAGAGVGAAGALAGGVALGRKAFGGSEKTSATAPAPVKTEGLKRIGQLFSGAHLKHLKGEGAQAARGQADALVDRALAQAVHVKHPSEKTWKEVNRAQGAFSQARDRADDVADQMMNEKLKVYGTRAGAGVAAAGTLVGANALRRRLGKERGQMKQASVKQDIDATEAGRAAATHGALVGAGLGLGAHEVGHGASRGWTGVQNAVRAAGNLMKSDDKAPNLEMLGHPSPSNRRRALFAALGTAAGALHGYTGFKKRESAKDLGVSRALTKETQSRQNKKREGEKRSSCELTDDQMTLLYGL